GKKFAQTEIINVADPDEMRQAFRPFIHSNHYEVHSDFGKSILAQYPRRSCEALWEMFMMNHPYDELSVPKTTDWNELREWFEPFISVEVKDESAK
ncbi:MAG: hypothetical protein DRP47_10125, partial [Candidatus Zixiibacteriota bacterium]